MHLFYYGNMPHSSLNTLVWDAWDREAVPTRQYTPWTSWPLTHCSIRFGSARHTAKKTFWNRMYYIYKHLCWACYLNYVVVHVYFKMFVVGGRWWLFGNSDTGQRIPNSCNLIRFVSAILGDSCLTNEETSCSHLPMHDQIQRVPFHSWYHHPRDSHSCMLTMHNQLLRGWIAWAIEPGASISNTEWTEADVNAVSSRKSLTVAHCPRDNNIS